MIGLYSIKGLVLSFVRHESDLFSTALPTIQAVFSIPVRKNGSNHTPQFAESARAIEAHEATITTSKVLAATALRVLADDEFYGKVARTDTHISIATDWHLPRLAFHTTKVQPVCREPEALVDVLFFPFLNM